MNFHCRITKVRNNKSCFDFFSPYLSFKKITFYLNQLLESHFSRLGLEEGYRNTKLEIRSWNNSKKLEIFRWQGNHVCPEKSILKLPTYILLGQQVPGSRPKVKNGIMKITLKKNLKISCQRLIALIQQIFPPVLEQSNISLVEPQIHLACVYGPWCLGRRNALHTRTTLIVAKGSHYERLTEGGVHS